MILISSSASIRKAFHIVPVSTVPTVPANDWYRHWRVDARKNHELGEIMLFTNYETLYTITADSRNFRRTNDMLIYFLFRYVELFGAHFKGQREIKENIIIHKEVNLSVTGVMNGMFQRINSLSCNYGHSEIENLVNQAPIGSSGITPLENLTEKLSK